MKLLELQGKWAKFYLPAIVTHSYMKGFHQWDGSHKIEKADEGEDNAAAKQAQTDVSLVKDSTLD